MYQFLNRSEAGKRLVPMLKKYRNVPSVVLAVPRGGVSVAYEVSKELNLPLEVIMVKKVGHPLHKEYAIGGVGLKNYFFLPRKDVKDEYKETEILKVRAQLQKMQDKISGGFEPEDISGKIAILIDDGIATGNTILAAIKVLKKSYPAKLVVAVPVISKNALEKVAPEVDELITILIPENFYGVGSFYTDFSRLSDNDVINYLKKSNELRRVG